MTAQGVLSSPRGCPTQDRPPAGGIDYVAFCNPSGGSQDAMALAVAHHHDGRAVLDAVREIRPPFSPEAVVAEFAVLLRQYGIGTVLGDRYAGEWPRERFRQHGIEYSMARRSKAERYAAVLPVINSGRVELLDEPRLVAQLCALSARTAWGGRDAIDHGPGLAARSVPPAGHRIQRGAAVEGGALRGGACPSSTPGGWSCSMSRAWSRSSAP